jgi:hypothetical protein
MKKSKASKDVAPATSSMREVSGPFDPFTERRNAYITSEDPMIQVCGWIARAWREIDAIEITGVDETKWQAWKIDNATEMKAAMVLGQALIFSEIRGVALGITSRRGQAASQKLLLEMLGAKEPPSGKKNLAEHAAGNLSPEKQAQAMGEFDTDKLMEYANFDDDANNTSRGTG